MIFTNLIKTNLRTKSLGKDIEYYQRLDSTNDESWNLIKDGSASHGMIVITDNQIKGKGRNNNNWHMSPSKGLAMSIILQKNLNVSEAKLIPLAAGIAAAQAIENRGGSPTLKWPNDIFINEKKIGGILCESKISSGSIKEMVVGIGINVNENSRDFPEEIVKGATSLYIETGYSHQRELMCAIYTTFFERLLDQLPSTTRMWSSYCDNIGKLISFNFNNKKRKGIFKGINEDGRARLLIDEKIKLFDSIVLD